MIYLLDSNTCIIYLKRPLSKVKQQLESLSQKDIALCSVVKAELFYGARKSNNPQKYLAVQQVFFNRFVCLDFDSQAAEIYGVILCPLHQLRYVHCEWNGVERSNHSYCSDYFIKSDRKGSFWKTI